MELLLSLSPSPSPRPDRSDALSTKLFEGVPVAWIAFVKYPALRVSIEIGENSVPALNEVRES